MRGLSERTLRGEVLRVRMHMTYEADGERNNLEVRPRHRLERTAHVHCVDKTDIDC